MVWVLVVYLMKSNIFYWNLIFAILYLLFFTEEPAIAIFSTDSRATLPENTDNFSEVNLYSKTELINNKNVGYSPLEDLDSPPQLSFQKEDNKDLSEEPHSLTAGLSASFAQLPTVASTVFSTFSRVIKGSSPLPGEISSFDHQSEQQQQVGQIQDNFNRHPLPPCPRYVLTCNKYLKTIFLSSCQRVIFVKIFNS